MNKIYENYMQIVNEAAMPKVDAAIKKITNKLGVKYDSKIYKMINSPHSSMSWGTMRKIPGKGELNITIVSDPNGRARAIVNFGGNDNFNSSSISLGGKSDNIDQILKDIDKSLTSKPKTSVVNNKNRRY